MYDEVKLSFHDKKNALNREIYSILLHTKMIEKKNKKNLFGYLYLEKRTSVMVVNNGTIILLRTQHKHSLFSLYVRISRFRPDFTKKIHNMVFSKKNEKLNT